MQSISKKKKKERNKQKKFLQTHPHKRDFKQEV